jgi:mRNA interferase RelE/StbE
LVIVKAISNDVYEDLNKIEEDEAFNEAEKIWKQLKINPYLGEPLFDRPDLDIYLEGCYKIYFYNKKYRFVYMIDDDNEIIVLIITIGKRDNLEVYKEADERLNKDI